MDTTSEQIFHYIVYDERAKRDEDDATIMLCIGDTTKAKAVAEFKRDWISSGAVLFEYDIEGNRAVNGRLIKG